MNDRKSETPMYQTEDELTKIKGLLNGKIVWLTQNQMAELLQTTKNNISIHVKNIFPEREFN